MEAEDLIQLVLNKVENRERELGRIRGLCHVYRIYIKLKDKREMARYRAQLLEILNAH